MGRWMTPDRWTAVVCLAIAGLLIAALPSQTSDRPLPGVRGFEVLDGAFFPKIAIVLFIIAAVWLLIEARPRATAGTEAPGDHDQAAQTALEIAAAAGEDQPPGISLRNVLGAIGLAGGLLVYVQVVTAAGYLASTIVGVSLLALVCGQRSPVGLFFGGAVFPAVVYYIFSEIFLVPLPRGTLWFG